MSVQTEASKQAVDRHYIALINRTSLALAISLLYILAIEAFVLALHNVQSMIYTSSKRRRVTYNILVYSDKHLSVHVHVVVARAKLKLSRSGSPQLLKFDV